MSSTENQNLIRCPSCGKYCKDSFHFCRYCGTSLTRPDNTRQNNAESKANLPPRKSSKGLQILFIAIAICAAFMLGILIAGLAKNGRADIAVAENDLPRAADAAPEMIVEEDAPKQKPAEKTHEPDISHAADDSKAEKAHGSISEEESATRDAEEETNEEEYNAAIALLESGEYYRAYDALRKLNGYKDSMEMADALEAGELVSSNRTPPFSLTPSELTQEILLIRDYYYNPTSEVTVITKKPGSNDLQYCREYYLLNGRLFFAFLYDGEDQHRLYFKDDNLIRYIGPDHVEHDYPNIDQYENWACIARKEVYFGTEYQ